MDLLNKIGLTKYESLVYTTLLKIGRSNAFEVAEHSKVPQTAVYPALNALLEKKLIQKIHADPALFEPLPSDTALKIYLERKESEFAELKKATLDYANSVKQEPKLEKRKEVVWISEGKPASAEFYHEACKRAKKSYYILGWRFDKVTDKYTFLRMLKQLSKNGVDVRIILTGEREKKNHQLIEDYKEEGISLRYAPLDNFSIFVVDAKECKITIKNRELPNRFNVHVLDADLAKAMHVYFLELWEKSEEID